jgi:micrococcal nuclease
MGYEAKAFLERKLMQNGKLKVSTFKDDKYGHPLAVIYMEGEEASINQQMLELGYVWAYDGGSKIKDLESLRKPE